MKRKIKLFNLINIGRVKTERNKDIFYIFGVPIFSIKQYSHKFNGHDNEWTRAVYKTCKCGKNLWCGGPTRLTRQCELADNVSFNGCEVHGDGRVYFGKHMHSGVQLLIITRNHNYDKGQHIPYSPDDYVRKDIIIGDFVWQLGNGKIGGDSCLLSAPDILDGGGPAILEKERIYRQNGTSGLSPSVPSGCQCDRACDSGIGQAL